MTNRRIALLLALLWVAVPAEASIQEYKTQTKTATGTATATDATLWTPLTGRRFALQGCHFSSIAAIAIELEVSNTDVVPPIYLDSYGSKSIGGNDKPIHTSDTNDVLTYTVTFTGHTPLTSVSWSILCWGYEYSQ